MPVRKVSLDGNSKSAKKPGLSALMPDKTPKAVAARNRAVKRMFTATTKKAARKTTAAAPVKAAQSKKPAVAATANIAPKKASAAAQTLTKQKPQPVRTRTPFVARTQRDEPVVVLPERVSVRAQEKVLAILSTLTKDFKHSAEKISYASGFCFVLFGSYVALSFSGALPSVLTPQSAQLLSGTLDEVQKTTTTTTATQKTLQPTTTAPRPTFSLLDPLPPFIDGVSKHTIEVKNAELVDVSAFSLTTGKKTAISYEKVVDSTFRLSLDPSSLAPSGYVIKVTLDSTFDDSKYVFKVGQFEVKPPLTDVSYQTSSSSSATPEASTATEEPADEGASDDAPPVVTKAEEKLTVTTDSSVLSDRTIVKVAAPSGARTVELYVRPLKSSTKRFIGLAEKYNGVWQYFFNTKDVPNGEYEIVARTKIDGQLKEASSARVSVVNFAPAPAEESGVEPTELEAIEPEIKIDPANGRSFSDVSLYSVSAESAGDPSASSTPLDTQLNIDSIVSLYRNDLEDVLKRYAVAKQSEDPLMLELVERELHDVRTTMVREVLLDPTINDLADDVDTVIEERFANIKRRVDTFEELRRTATERASAVDRDGDGISDFDETNLYQTNPDTSDTDNDGVTDGIEVMRGFDPLNPVAEVVVAYEMPQDTIGLVVDDTLRIDAVTPIVKTDDPTIAPIVQSEIRGTSLPNSYVTIYIFSTPTIVTVRTEEDGSFVYTFEKELEDGEHEVYVAVTDNTGAIMARSNPFRFVKQAEAYSPVTGTVAAPPDMTLSGIQIFGSYNVAVGLGILAFGMILLMLGATLRERDGFIMTNPKNDVATS